MGELPGQFGALLVQGSPKSSVSDSHSELHFLAGLFHVIDRQVSGVGSVKGRQGRLVRLVLEVEYHPEPAVGHLEQSFPVTFQFLRHRRAGRDQFHLRLARAVECDRLRAPAGDRPLHAPVRAQGQVESSRHEFEGNKLHGLAVYRHILHNQACFMLRGKAHAGDPLRFRVLCQVERHPNPLRAIPGDVGFPVAGGACAGGARVGGRRRANSGSSEGDDGAGKRGGESGFDVHAERSIGSGPVGEVIHGSFHNVNFIVLDSVSLAITRNSNTRSGEPVNCYF